MKYSLSFSSPSLSLPSLSPGRICCICSRVQNLPETPSIVFFFLSLLMLRRRLPACRCIHFTWISFVCRAICFGADWNAPFWQRDARMRARIPRTKTGRQQDIINKCCWHIARISNRVSKQQTMREHCYVEQSRSIRFDLIKFIITRNIRVRILLCIIFFLARISFLLI